MTRSMTRDDLPVVVEMEEGLFPENSMGEKTLATELSLGMGWVDDDPISGYLLARHGGGVLDITRLGVSPRARRRGVGTKLLESALELGHPTILTVRKDNEAAIRLYWKHGFRIVGHLPLADAWMMRVDPAKMQPKAG